jgi:DNA-binding transcriptional LysR family regulator
MNPNALRYFLEVAEAGSFRRAADSLRVAASAINRQISLLEADLQAPLFERSRGRSRLRLTDAGQILVRYGRAAMDEVERARYEIGALRGLRAGNIVLGVPETFGGEFLPQFLARFHAAYPRISFRVLVTGTAREIELLLADEVEVALIYHVQLPASIDVMASLDRERYVMMRADHPLAKRRWVRLTDIASYPLIMPDHGIIGAREIYDRIFAKLRVKPQTILTTSSYNLLRSAAQVGLGIAIVNEYLDPLRADRDPDVAFVRIRDSVVKPQKLWCAIRRGRKLSVAAMAFVDRIKTEFQAIQRKSAAS